MVVSIETTPALYGSKGGEVLICLYGIQDAEPIKAVRLDIVGSNVEEIIKKAEDWI